MHSCLQGAGRRAPDKFAGILSSSALALCAEAAGGDLVRGALCSEIGLEGGGAPEWVQLFPKGPDLAAIDGRRWQMSDPAAVAARTDERRGSLRLVVDWEHAADRKAPQGDRTPAAGWISELAVREGVLMGRVAWTDRGAADIESKAYAYLSPSFYGTRKITARSLDGGPVQFVTSVSLVNRPAFDMPALAGEQLQEEESMLKKILEALGLAADATKEQALAAIGKLTTERDELKAQASAAPGLADYVHRATYDAVVARATAAETELASVRSAGREETVRDLLDQAQADGKIAPASRQHFESLCGTDGGLESVRKFLADAPRIAKPTSGMDGPPPGSGGTGTQGFASAEERRVTAQFGRDAKFLDQHAPRSQGVN